MTRNGPTRPDPAASEAIRRSLYWVGGAVAGLLVCLLVIPRAVMAANVSEATAMSIGQFSALALGIVCIVKIRSIWRQ